MSDLTSLAGQFKEVKVSFNVCYRTEPRRRDAIIAETADALAAKCGL